LHADLRGATATVAIAHATAVKRSLPPCVRPCGTGAAAATGRTPP
jgi:hypothetical protein